jgi:hypothetical protein
MGDLLRVVLKHQSEVAAQGVLFQLPPGQALDGLLHGAQFAQTLPRIGQTNIDRLEGTLDQLRLVGQHGADSGDFVSEDGGLGMCDLAKRADQCGAVGVKVEPPPPVLARGFLQPAAPGQVVEHSSRHVTWWQGHRQFGWQIFFVIRLVFRMMGDHIGNDVQRLAAFQAVRLLCAFAVQSIENIDVSRRVFSRQHPEERRIAHFTVKAGREEFGHE